MRVPHIDRACTQASMHTQAQVCSAISALAFQPLALGARNDLNLFLLINAYLLCTKMRGCREENMRHLKQWNLGDRSLWTILHAAPHSSLGLWRQINLFFYGNSIIEHRRYSACCHGDDDSPLSLLHHTGLMYLELCLTDCPPYPSRPDMKGLYVIKTIAFWLKWGVTLWAIDETCKKTFTFFM